jgi:hypothetical protein
MTERQNSQAPELYSQEEYVEQARRAMASFADIIQELAEANRSLLEARDQLFSFNVHGSLTTSYPAFYDLECTALATDGSTLHFRGFSWAGPGPAQTFFGQFIGGASFSVPPSELVGDVDFSVSMTQHNIPPAQMRIDWYTGRPPGYKLVGTYLGDSPTPMALPPFNGRGTWIA